MSGSINRTCLYRGSARPPVERRAWFNVKLDNLLPDRTGSLIRRWYVLFFVYFYPTLVEFLSYSLGEKFPGMPDEQPCSVRLVTRRKFCPVVKMAINSN